LALFYLFASCAQPFIPRLFAFLVLPIRSLEHNTAFGQKADPKIIFDNRRQITNIAGRIGFRVQSIRFSGIA
jgi:hypothetical protein